MSLNVGTESAKLSLLENIGIIELNYHPEEFGGATAGFYVDTTAPPKMKTKKMNQKPTQQPSERPKKMMKSRHRYEEVRAKGSRLYDFPSDLFYEIRLGSF